jgi:RNA polymerase sigma-70 factor (ECF subfamily)
MALLVLLERLTPEERTVFLLHEVFEHNHHQISGILGKSKSASRQLLHRARRRIGANQPRFKVNEDQCRNLVASFLRALGSNDSVGLVKLMSENATLLSDSGGRVRATLKCIRGSDRIARLLIGVRAKQAGRLIEKLMRINRDLGIVSYVEGQPVSILWFDIEGGEITRVCRILNPSRPLSLRAGNGSFCPVPGRCFGFGG